MISNLRPFPLLGQAHGSSPQGSGGGSFAFGVAIYHFELFFWRVGVVRVRSGALHGTTCVGWGDAAHPIRNHWNKEELIKFLLFIYILFFIYTIDVFLQWFCKKRHQTFLMWRCFRCHLINKVWWVAHVLNSSLLPLAKIQNVHGLVYSFLLRPYAITLKFCNTFYLPKQISN